MKKRVLFALLLTVTAILCLTVAVYAEDSDEITVDNGIPVVYLNIDETQGTIEDMIASPNHSVYCYGKIRIDVPEGFHYSDFPDLDCESLASMDMSIRGRGNSSWKKSKKPFKIKLDKKTDVFGLGANKHWVLIANESDPTLIKDRITGWLGDRMGFAFTPRGVPVDLVMTGQDFGTRYLGSYYFSENVRVDDNRLEIEELKEGDTDPDIITGGYLLQNALQVRDGSPDRFYTRRGVDWATDTPSFDTEDDGYANPAQQEYIQNYIRDLEDVLFEQGTAYRNVIDVESAAKYWLASIVPLNSDAYATGSTYIYKYRDTDKGVSKLYWGPLWDFDYAWGFNPGTDGFYCGHKWMKPMFYDKEEGGFLQEIYKQWPAMRTALLELTEENGVIDQYYEETKASAEQDHDALHPETDFDYKNEVKKLKTWINERVAWMDKHLTELEDLVHTVTFMADGKEYAHDFLEEWDYLTGNEPFPEKDGYTFMGWADEEGKIIDTQTYVKKDLTLTAVYVPDSELTHGKDIAFNKDCEIIRFSSFSRLYQIPYTVIPADAEDRRVVWTSSDKSIATVDHQGLVTYSGTGTVTFTGKLNLGKTRTFTLTITDEALPLVESIRPDLDEIRLKVGEQSPFTISTTPSPAGIFEYSYESEDESIVTVGDYGVLTAVGPGTVKVHVTAKVEDEEGYLVDLETYTTVIVTEDEGDNCPSKDFTDTDPDAWYHEAVDYVVEHGLMKGISSSKFDPQGTTSRAMIVTILYRLAGSPSVEPGARSSSPFDDVEEGSWYEDAVVWANANDIVNGMSETSFAPNRSITREQFATILYRYETQVSEQESKEDSSAAPQNDTAEDVILNEGTHLENVILNEVKDPSPVSEYTDADQISDWAKEAMEWAVAEGLINGMTKTTLEPAGSATRAQVAAIFMRFCEGKDQ